MIESKNETSVNLEKAYLRYGIFAYLFCLQTFNIDIYMGRLHKKLWRIIAKF